MKLIGQDVHESPRIYKKDYERIIYTIHGHGIDLLPLASSLLWNHP